MLGMAWEWYFRTFLDHWSSLFGMVFGFLLSGYSEWLKRVDGLEDAFKTQAAAMVIPGAISLVWAWTELGKEKFEYNALHPFLTPIPILGWIFFRNLTLSCRQRYLGLLAEAGKITLETYLLQHHLWMTSSAKSLLVFLPGWPLANYLAVSAVYVALAWRLQHATMELREVFLPNEGWPAAFLPL